MTTTGDEDELELNWFACYCSLTFYKQRVKMKVQCRKETWSIQPAITINVTQDMNLFI